MNEQGHAKNFESLTKARDFAVSWGAKYAPTNPLLSLTNLNKLIDDAGKALDDVQEARTTYRNATAAAEDVFAPLNKLVTRVMKALRVSGAPASVVADADTYARKIRGRSKSSAAKKDDPATPNVNESEKSYSTSQMSRTQRVENLDALILLLDSVGLYDPNETELQTATLKNVSTDLASKKDSVQTTFVPFSNKLAARDEIFYAEETGVVDVGRLFKVYIESFGRDSAEWSQIKDLEFKVIKRKK